MDELTDNDLDKALRAASDRAVRESTPSIVAVARALRRRLSGPDDPLTAVVAALEYHPVVDPLNDGRTSFEELLGHIDTDVFALWARALAHSPRPLVAARFADLLWCVRYGDTAHEWGQRAVDASLASVYDQFGHVLEISEGLQRALEIATQIDDGPRASAVVAALVGHARRSIDGEHPSSGVALSSIEFLADRPPRQRPSDLDALIERAIDHYRADAFLLEAALDIKAALAGPEQREELRLAQVDAFADLARSSSGVVRYAHFQYAIRLAERHLLLAVADQLRDELAAPVPTAPDVLPSPLATFAEQLVGNDDLVSALARFGACNPTETASGEPAGDEAARLLFFAPLAVDVLGGARDRYGSLEAAHGWFVSPLIDESAAQRIARAIELYEAGEFDASASVLAPRVERIVRSVAGAFSAPSERYLGAILDYGMPDVASATDAALLIHAACHLRLLEPRAYA